MHPGEIWTMVTVDHRLTCRACGTQVECNIPGCAPIETVVSVFCDGQNLVEKIYKPISEVSLEEVQEAVKLLQSQLVTGMG